ncbi:EcsC family protein [Arthrobacter sp. 1P04PC]|uniref:EcsC family protein n=1 Tax=unclassified Arthrobacter TaxID=235627 RepID=UPI0039A1798F
MTEPSEYEIEAWRNVQAFKGRPLSQIARNAGEKAAAGVEELGQRASRYLEDHPTAESVVARSQTLVAKGAQKISVGARKAKDAIPDGIGDWGNSAFGAMRQTAGRVSRVGLSPKQVVAKHKKRGHEVSRLMDLRKLDLEQIDAVRGRAMSWAYPLAAALSGASAGLVISGGELAIPVTAGASAAPSAGVIAAAVVGDAAVVLGLASRSVGHVSLLYGYDPEEPAEKLFVMSVVNAGTALSSSAKTAAMADVSRLTQSLARGKSWAVLLDGSVVANVSKKFAEKFTVRLTKQGLGKVVPAAGIVLGGTFNWATLESIVDVADIEYRKRFLLEKYPHLAETVAEAAQGNYAGASPSGSDEDISVMDELAAAGGPDLR